MLSLNPPLAALHGARLDHSGAVAHGLLSAAEHFSASALRLQSHMLDRLLERYRSQSQPLSPMLALDVATDPTTARLSASIVHEQIHLGADLGARWIALGEWHQHGFNAVLSNWLDHCEKMLGDLPAAGSVSVMKKALESADRSVSEAAVVAVGATEVMVEEAEQLEKIVQPRRRGSKQS